jgi:hypothetical protein
MFHVLSPEILLVHSASALDMLIGKTVPVDTGAEA